jgi:hypothetical protein
MLIGLLKGLLFYILYFKTEPVTVRATCLFYGQQNQTVKQGMVFRKGISKVGVTLLSENAGIMYDGSSRVKEVSLKILLFL